jgi:capsular exopolysaccharide synthesis family protein
MNLKDYLAIFWRRRWVITVTAVVTLAVTGIGTLLSTPVYKATTTLRVTTTFNPAADYVSYDNALYADRLLNTYSKLATSGSTQRELARRLGVEEAPRNKVDLPANTELIQITVEHSDPLLATTAANTLAQILVTSAEQESTNEGKPAHEVLRERLESLERGLAQAGSTNGGVSSLGDDQASGGASLSPRQAEEEVYRQLLQQYERARTVEAMRANAIRVVDPAILPQAPALPNRMLNLAVGLLVGLASGIGLGFLFENLDTRLYTVRGLEEATAFPLFGVVPHAVTGQRSGLIASGSAQEAYRHLRAHLLAIEGGKPPGSILVAGAEPGAGTSTIAANLAVVFGESGFRATVVDANLRRPSMHRIFGLPNQVGLSSVLWGANALEESLQPSPFPGVEVLTGGPSVPHPGELLGSGEMAALFRRLAAESDVVLVDAPALLAVADAVPVATRVDRVLLVVTRAKSRTETLIAACRMLTSIGVKEVGVVLNGAQPDYGHTYYEQDAPASYVGMQDLPKPTSALCCPTPSGRARNERPEATRGPSPERFPPYALHAVAAGERSAVRLAEGARWPRSSAEELGTSGPVGPRPGKMLGDTVQNLSSAPRRLILSILSIPFGMIGILGLTALMDLGAPTLAGLQDEVLSHLASAGRQTSELIFAGSQASPSPGTVRDEQSLRRTEQPVDATIAEEAGLPLVLPTEAMSGNVFGAAAPLRTVLDERFVDNTAGWSNDALSTAWFADGAYRLFARQPSRFVALRAPVPQTAHDVVVTASFRKIGGPPGGGYGVIVRDQDPEHRDGVSQNGRYYVLEAGDRGEVGIWRREDDRWIDLVPWTESNAVSTGAEQNQLVVRAIGQILTLSINGTQVATVADGALTAGGVGVFVGGDFNDVALDRFRVELPHSGGGSGHEPGN